jgi:dienelactone hydrolase
VLAANGRTVIGRERGTETDIMGGGRLSQTCDAVVMNRSMIDVPTPDGVADCYLTKPADSGAHPGVLFMMDGIGLRPRIEEMADRIAAEGYVVLAPNVFYRGGRAPLWETPDLHDADSRAAFFRTLGPLMGALTPAAAAADGGAYLDTRGAHRWPGRGHRLLLRRLARVDGRRRAP